MVKNNTVSNLLMNFCLDGYLDREILNKYESKKTPKNLRICLEKSFKLDLFDITNLRSNVFDSWERKTDVWNDTELILFRYLLRCNGVATLSELKKQSKLEINQVRDGVKGLEESATNVIPPLVSIKWQGNSKLVFISPYFINKMLNK